MTNNQDILNRNLDQLRRTEPQLAERLLAAKPAPLQWKRSKQGPWSAAVHEAGRHALLASRYDPMAEAEKLIEKVDFQKHAGIVALGMGLGYHVSLLAAKLDDAALLIVFEPDLQVMRAVFEQIDHTAWLGRHNTVLADDQMDRAALLCRIERFSGSLTQGTVMVTHPPSRQRHGEKLATAGQMVTDLLSYFRTNVATSLVNAARTIENLSMNVPYYAAGAGTDELHEFAKGCPAVCVGAGPSLAKNIDLLADDKVRQNVIVITAQTTLRPLLERGIRPDFVTALDYSAISTRFYEDLPDLPDVTMVAEPLAHTSILGKFPGPIRVTPSPFLDRLLDGPAPPRVAIAGGATVAHLSFYVAQHLGCDPIILIGQDLGFSDGLYYCPGTAIDHVWAPELGPFNTLEMMQWQRIARHRSHLEKVEDIHGRAIYSDDQMLTYLKQFERDFANAPQTVLDATEGGVRKQHTVVVTLAEALKQHATRPVPKPPLPECGFDRQKLAGAADRIAQRIHENAELRSLSKRTVPLLKKMLADQRDRMKMKRHFDLMTPLRKRVDELSDIFQIINELNVIGAFKRARADRAIEHAPADEFENQRLQLERDIENVEWLIQACDEAAGIFRTALENVEQNRGSSQPALAQPSVAA